MVAITQLQPVRQPAVSAEVNVVQPVRSTRATEEMTDIAAFQQLAMATHMARHQAGGGHRTLAQRLAASRERKGFGADVPGTEPDEKEVRSFTDVDGDSSKDRLPATRTEFEHAEMERLRRHLSRSGRGPSSEEDLAELKKKHAESINGGLDVAELLRESPGDSRRQLSEETALITGFKFGSKGKAIDPITLLDNLEQQFGKDRVDVALLDVKKAVGAEARKRPGDGPGPQSWRSFSLAAAYHALISSRAIGSDMRGKISGLGIQPKASVNETSRLMLKAPLLDDRTAEPFVAKLFDMENVSPSKRPAVYRIVRTAVSTLPTTMWPLESLSQRQLALSKLDTLSFHAPSQEHGGSSLQLRTESRERARIANLIK
ncbi:hypothetical protein QN362_13695 [Actimicrobium sp. CCC2.4]|uniref:hypothetical protein n=1 Tax=Actimicrobium sp. CCC2.4 TaxID=3048606 RepID=UPI002AC95927|nr:hypothetical protein [Actimicrobium sp. CCC2.4]MEB0136391.1 hypothetical protein [Actimicrobium sp. CCC2.4]WPX31210.1 hypothetical protein RHM62_13250 [Actimicrobium sp. CCC2.4]